MTRQQIISLVREVGLRPDKGAGQNFLLDEAVVDSMIAAADIRSKDTVLEIGPGFGVLTGKLLATGAKVVAIELDQRLAAWLRKKYAKTPNLVLVEGDVFKINLHDHLQDGGYKLVANLPYSATSLVLRNFLSLRPRPSELTIMIQKEVAERVVAEPGNLSLLGLMVQYYSHPSYLFDVPAGSFWPEPKVTSAVIHCQVQDWPDERETKKLFRAARSGFSGKRKQLHNALAPLLGLTSAKTVEWLEKRGLPSTARAQDLSLETWLEIAKNLD